MKPEKYNYPRLIRSFSAPVVTYILDRDAFALYLTKLRVLINITPKAAAHALTSRLVMGAWVIDIKNAQRDWVEVLENPKRFPHDYPTGEWFDTVVRTLLSYYFSLPVTQEVQEQMLRLTPGKASNQIL
jgi:hypothetical protein